jgi:hypothetical protein
MARKTTNERRAGTTPTDTRMMNFAEDLGRILGTTQAKASAWLGQRQQIAKQLTQVRDTAERLLGELTGSGAKLAATVRRARKTAAAGPRPKRRRMSAEARRKISEAAKRRWAAVRAAKKGRTSGS